MNLNLTLQFEPGDAAQIFAQDFFLDLELVIVAGVLVMASAAASEMGTGRLRAVRRRFYDGFDLCAGEAGLFFGEGGCDLLSGKNEGNEDGFAAAGVFVAGGSGRKASESVAAVDQLFNVQEQELILRCWAMAILRHFQRSLG